MRCLFDFLLFANFFPLCHDFIDLISGTYYLYVVVKEGCVFISRFEPKTPRFMSLFFFLHSIFPITFPVHFIFLDLVFLCRLVILFSPGSAVPSAYEDLFFFCFPLLCLLWPTILLLFLRTLILFPKCSGVNQ